MPKTTRNLILKLVRFQNNVEAMRDAMVAAYDIDCMFDGGEFSGPAMMAAADRRRDALAHRIGFANADLAYDVAELLRCTTHLPAYAYGDIVQIPN